MTMEEYYILLVEKVAIKKERGLTPRPLQQKANQSETQVLEGSLWRVPVDDREKQRQSADLHSVEFEGVVLYNFPLNSPDIQKLTPDQFNLLLAVPTCKDRNEVFLNKQWLAEAVHLQIGSIVYLVNLPGFTEPRIPGKVRYKGSLPHEQGTWFGVELSKEHQGKGTSDGNYRRKRFFTCHMDSAVFKSINKLAYCANPQEFTEGDDLSVNAELNYPGILPPPPPLSLGERVVWINDAKVEPAVVKWIGILPDTREPIEWMIGVEFEHQVGTGTGKYKDQQLFKARQGHASLVPAMGLMLESEYYGHFGAPHSPQHESFNTMSSTRSTIPRNFTASAHSSTSSRHNTMPTPSPSRQSTLPLREHELQTISRQETHSPDGKYEPTISSNTLPLSKQVISPEKFVPQRNHAQYFGHHASLPKNSSLVTNRSQSTQSLERAVEPSSNELDHLSGHMEGRFSTIHHSQPSQIVRLPPESSPTSATTGRSVHSKYQQNRYQHALGSDALCFPPARPEKNIREKEGMSIYDQHPYENMDGGPPRSDSSEDVYDFGDWEAVTKDGELSSSQFKFRSSGDVRTRHSSTMSRFTVGSVDALDRKFTTMGTKVTDPVHLQPELKEETYDNFNNFKASEVPQEREHFDHSYNDPPPYPGNELYEQPEPISSLVSPESTESSFTAFSTAFSQNHPDTVQYKTHTKTKKGNRAKSVDNILVKSEFEPCPRYTGNSVFYQPVAINDETLERDYGNLGLNTNSESSSQSQVTKSKRGYSSADELDMDYNTSTSTSHRTHEFSSSELRKQYSDGTEPVYAKSSKSFREHDTKSESFGTGSMRPSLRSYEKKRPVALTADEANTDLEIGCTVEVIDNPENSRYGVIRWLGYLGDKNKPLVGLEMEVENKSCTDGKFGEFQLFECPPNKGFFVYLNKLRKDSRFEESPDFADRRNSLAFGSIECHEIAGAVLAPAHVSSLSPFIGKNKGIQGHHNSCYMDATLFSMFAFTTAFDGLLQWERGGTTIKDRVQIALREAIVNPLRKNFFVRADKVMNLRVLLDEHSKVQGLTHAEKDPEEFLNSLLQDTLKAEPFIKLSNGLQANMYQLILDKDEEIILPTTQKLLGLSFLQANLKLTECPKSLILQMPRCGKRFKMYQRIVPSLTLDITDLLDEVPRECTICSGLATYECQDCFKHFGDGSFLDITFCNDCLYKSHSHVKRASHNPTPLQIPQSMADQYNSPGGSLKSSNPPDIPRVTLGLFAVICIETSHYVSFVKAGKEPNSPWLFFDSMADRMGEQHGYNVPQVKVCRELPEWLREGAREKIVACRDNRDLPEHVRRVICDGYICMYQQQDTPTHAQNR